MTEFLEESIDEIPAIQRSRINLTLEEYQAQYQDKHQAIYNAFAESVFKTLKYCPKYPVSGFNTLEEAQSWVLQFTRWYNNGLFL